jgi:hypothetical protein
MRVAGVFRTYDTYLYRGYQSNVLSYWVLCVYSASYRDTYAYIIKVLFYPGQ